MALAPDPDRPSDHDWTVEEYMQIDDDRRFEVLSGELVMVPSPNAYHQTAITKLGQILGRHVDDRELGRCFDAPFDVVLAEDTVVQPDLVFVREERFAELYDGHGITGAPDFVAEVVSPSTETRDRHRKRQLYAEAGVEWFLLVVPKARVVEVLQLGEEGKYVVDTTAADDDLLTFGLFPELDIDLSEIWFEPPDEDPPE